MASSVFIANASSSDFNKMLIGFSLCFSVKNSLFDLPSLAFLIVN